MAMDGTPESGITEGDKAPDIHKENMCGRGNENISPEDVHESEHDPFLCSQDPRCSPDGFPGLSGNDRKHGRRSDQASDFWSRGVAIWRALDTRSNGNKRIGDSNSLTKESGNPATEGDTAESVPTRSRDQLHCSKTLSFLESDSTSAIPPRVDHQARPVPNSSDPDLKKVPNSRIEPLGPPPEDPSRSSASDVAGLVQSLELEIKKCRSTTAASVSNSPTKSRGGDKYDQLKGADDIPLHADRVGISITTHVEIEDDLQVPPCTGKSKPAIPTGPRLHYRPSSRPSWGSELYPQKRRQNLETPPKPSLEPRYKESSSAKTTSRVSESPSVTPITPITPTSNRRIQHLKSLSADAPAFHPRSPSSSPITPISSYRNDHKRSVSIGSGRSFPSHVSVMPKTPSRQHSVRHSRHTSMGTPSIPIESGVLRNLGAPSQPSPGYYYPEPHQHTPEGQGQVFDIQGSIALQMPAQFSDSFSPNMPPLSSSFHSSNNNTIYQNAQVYEQGEHDAEYSQSNHFDSYTTSQAANAAPNAADLHQNGNIYTQDTNGYGPRYYSNHTDPTHQLNQNLYSPLEPHREPSKPNQKTAKDLFIPEDLRLKLHARTEATLRVFAVMNAPAVEHYHTLTPLTAVNQQQNQTWHGYSSTTYKAVSAKDGRTYCLRRIHDFRATKVNENAIYRVRKTWTAIRNSSVVSLHSVFTTPNFEDSSLIVVSDYHPDSKTVAEKHFSQTPGRSNRNTPPLISDDVLWGYIVQITNALKAVHSAKLAVRVFEPTKVIVTDENRIRLSGCALEDLLDSEAHDIADLQRLDFHKFGNFILALGTNNMSSSSRVRAVDVFAQNYYKGNPQLRTVVEWLLGHDRPESNEGVDVLIKLISSNAIDAFNSSLQLNDELYFSVNKEVDNSRIVRLMTKLSCLNERPEYEHDRTYSTQGPRAVLSLFRDYVFHQVNAQANPVVDMGHILSCLNKLDAGIEERIALTARDEQSVIVVSYKELKGALEGTWQELMRRSAG